MREDWGRVLLLLFFFFCVLEQQKILSFFVFNFDLPYIILFFSVKWGHINKLLLCCCFCCFADTCASILV